MINKSVLALLQSREVYLISAAHRTLGGMDTWDPLFMDRSPMLAALREAATGLCGVDWPSVAALQIAVDRAGVRSGSGMALRLVLPAQSGLEASAYEQRVYGRGELEVRERNWHDLFNVLAWLTFPRAKAALNARHCAVFENDPQGRRGPVRDALTLFDESGVIVVSVDAALLQMIRDFQWRSLFWTHRAAVVRDLRCLLFGHALCEKALAPYKGVTGRGLLFEIDREFLELSLPEQLTQIDSRLAAQIADPRALLVTNQLAPVPVLGVPGWCAENEEAGYYEDQNYFRTGRRVTPAPRG